MVNEEEETGATSSSSTANSDIDTEERRHVRTWTSQIEKLLADWGDVALCYTWLHDRAYRKYNMLNYKYSIPIIVFSTLTGTANFGLHGIVPVEYSQYAQILIGFTSIFTGVLGTLQNFFRYAQRSESHANALQGWSKLYRNISIELSLERGQRKNADDFLKACKTEYDRLVENSPSIPSDVIAKFMDKFKHSADFNLPLELSTSLSHTFVYKERRNKPPRPAGTALFDVLREAITRRKRGDTPPSSPEIDLQGSLHINTGNVILPDATIDMPDAVYNVIR